MNTEERHLELMNDFRQRINDLNEYQVTFQNLDAFSNKNRAIKEGVEAQIQEIEHTISNLKERANEQIDFAKKYGFVDERDPLQRLSVIHNEIISRLEKDLQWRNLISELEEKKEIPSLYALAGATTESQNELAKLKATKEIEQIKSTGEVSMFDKMIEYQKAFSPNNKPKLSQEEMKEIASMVTDIKNNDKDTKEEKPKNK